MMPRMDYGFVHDKSGNILEINDGVRPERSQTFVYDGLSRLTHADGGYQGLEYRYNPRGDRTRIIRRSDNGGEVMRTNFRFDEDTARMIGLERNGVTSRELTYSESGQITSDTKNGVETSMTLNARGRMATVTRAGQAVAEYGYGIHQLRVSKALGDGTIIHYHYDDQGRMISETDGVTGAILREYIWFGLSPVAITGVDGLHFIHTDHLGRPTFVTDPSGTSVWDGGITTPFGVSLNTVGAFTQNLMFPGQYRDEETGYDQNWNRTYDPELGRYLQSDPIGLAGGLNRYAYVGGNPVSYVDPRGLNSTTFPPGSAFGIAASQSAKKAKTAAKTRNIYGLCLSGGFAIGGFGMATYLEAKNLMDIHMEDDFCDECSDEGLITPLPVPADQSRAIPWPGRSRRQWNATCRADDLTVNNSNGLSFAFGHGVGPTESIACRAAEFDAVHNLGATTIHHVQCKSMSPKGVRGYCGRTR